VTATVRADPSAPPRNRVDLHTHTSRSDGVLAPAELYAAMAAHGMALVAITDHDTLAGVAELQAAGAAVGHGPRIIAGIEINTVGTDVLARRGLGRDGEELHILGYGLDPADPVFATALARQRSGRRDRIALTLERVRALGMAVDLDPERVTHAPEVAIGRPHVARALVRAGHAASVDDAFDRFLDVGRPCYVPRLGLGPREAIEAIGAAGGIAVLAHSPEAADRPEVMGELMDWGLRGLEVHYRTFDPATVERLAAFAAARGLLATGGSDYHGDTMDYATAQETTRVPDAVGDRLLAALAAPTGTVS
jgi:predicted metal-dependent phosphoesterase TrpH